MQTKAERDVDYRLEYGYWPNDPLMYPPSEQPESDMIRLDLVVLFSAWNRMRRQPGTSRSFGFREQVFLVAPLLGCILMGIGYLPFCFVLFVVWLATRPVESLNFVDVIAENWLLGIVTVTGLATAGYVVPLLLRTAERLINRAADRYRLSIEAAVVRHGIATAESE